MSVDILPASIPLDASKSFSSALEPHLKNLINYTMTPTTSGTLPPDLERATIASRGVLAEKHKWLQSSVDEFRKPSRKMEASTGPWMDMAKNFHSPTSSISDSIRKKRILMFGSGMVATPAVDLIAQRSDVELIIGISKTIESSFSL
jgi:alpha-aminoadipic semialdehyde synthase